MSGCSLELLGADAGPFLAWLSMGAAEDYATLGERDACLRAMEEADRQLDSGDGDGFYSTRGFFGGSPEVRWAPWRGWCYALLGDTGAALAEFAAAGSPATTRQRVILSVNSALAHTVAGDPDSACAGVAAVDDSLRGEYAYGLE